MIRQGQTIDAGTLYRPVFNIPQSGVPVRIDPSSFKGSDFCDDNGLLVPGTPLAADGTLAGNAVDETAVFVLPYAVQIADSNTDADLDAAPDGDVAARTAGDVILDRLEGNLGRALTANETAAFGASGRFTLI